MPSSGSTSTRLLLLCRCASAGLIGRAVARTPRRSRPRAWALGVAPILVRAAPRRRACRLWP
eukprot:9614870-Alexandrium_andersonii.AAC.1